MSEGRIWFWRPQWHWFGWRTLIPFGYGHDEFARRVLIFGWTITGRILIAVWSCGDPEGIQEAVEHRQQLKEEKLSQATSVKEFKRGTFIIQ